MQRPGVSRARLLDAAIAALAALSLLLALTGGGRLIVAGVTISAHNWRRPALAAALLFLGRAASHWVRRERSTRLQRFADETAAIGFGALLLIVPALWLHYLVKACGGLDSHGYVSTAALLLTGSLSAPQPEAEWLPVDAPIEPLAPLGYVPSPDGRAIVPRFPLGLPLVMALFRAVLGPGGPFYVAPVLGAAAVVLSYAIVRRRSGQLTAGLAAVLLAVHPVFVTYAIQPMSDVPATFWLVLAAFLIDRDPARPAMAGVAAGIAMLTRPPLLLPALVLARVGARRGPGVAARFLAGFLPWPILLLAAHWSLYGNPLISGYGTAGALFTVAAVPWNMWAYGKWLLAVHTPLFPLAIAAGWLLADRRFATDALLLFVAVAIPYLVYRPAFDDWEMLRFLLPGLAFLVMASAQGIMALLERVRLRPVAPLLALTIAGALAAASYGYLRERNVFRLWSAESKYPAVAAWFTANSADSAVVLASLHSGSIRYYSGRLTLRWDRIPPERLAATIAAFADRGRDAYLVLDADAERTEFAERFGAAQGVRVEIVARVREVYIASVGRETAPPPPR